MEKDREGRNISQWQPAVTDKDNVENVLPRHGSTFGLTASSSDGGPVTIPRWSTVSQC